MWRGSWVAFPVTVSLVPALTWTLPVSVTSWLRNSTCTHPVAMAGSLESTETRVVWNSYSTLITVQLFLWLKGRLTKIQLIWLLTSLYVSLVPVWSGVNVAGVSLQSLNPSMGSEGDSEHWKEVHKLVVDGWVQHILKTVKYTVDTILTSVED